MILVFLSFTLSDACSQAIPHTDLNLTLYSTRKSLPFAAFTYNSIPDCVQTHVKAPTDSQDGVGRRRCGQVDNRLILAVP